MCFLPVLAGKEYCWLIAVLPRPLAGGKAIILGRVFNDGRNFSIFNYATFSLQTQISLLQVEVFYYFKLRAETYFICVQISAAWPGVYLLIVWQQTK